MIQFGGQTPLKLARAIEAAGFKVLGTPYEAVDLAEDRERFGRLLAELGIRCPDWGIADRRTRRSRSRSGSATRSSSGRRTCSAAARCGSATTRRRCGRPWRGVTGSVLVDRFLEGAVEIDVDALCDGVSVHVGAVMEHVEEAGVHSGDSSCVLPAPSLDEEAYEEVCRVVRRLGPRSASSACSTSSSPCRRGGLRARGEPARLADGRRSRARRPASTSSTPPSGSWRAVGCTSSSCRASGAPSR